MKMTLNITAFLSGVIFGFGLLVSGFYNPNNVLSFFDIFGDWKVGLMITFILSIIISAMAFKVIKNRSLSFANNPVQLPDTKKLDLKLFAGAASSPAPVQVTDGGKSGHYRGYAVARHHRVLPN